MHASSPSRSRAHLLLGALALAALSADCSTPTTMTDVWRDPGYTRGPVRSLVVFGLRLDPANRRTLEDGFVSELGKHGVRGIASYTLLPDVVTMDVARIQVQKAGADGYLVASLQGTTERTQLIPGVYSGGFWEDYYVGEGWAMAPSFPGYVVTNDFVKFQTSLWDGRLGNGKLIWAATTETENPRSGKDFTRSLVRDIVPALVHAALLPPEQGKAVSSVLRPSAPVE
jgi:hypothetical protein